MFYRIGMIEKFDDYFEEVFEVFGTAEPWEVYPDVVQALDSLRKQGFELGVISNFDTRFYRIFRGLGLEGFFDSITISSMARSVKPSGDIFHYALSQHVADPEDAVHVGDSIREDMEGAERAGITGIWVNRERADPPQGAVHLRKEIQSLEQVGGFLAQL